MIIIFEGHDGSGKTTLLKHVSKELNMPIYSGPRKGYEKGSVEDFYSGSNEAALHMCEGFDNFVMDRFIISEYVYSKLYGRSSNVDFEEFLNRLEFIGKKIIFVIVSCGYGEYKNRIVNQKNEKSYRTAGSFREELMYFQNFPYIFDMEKYKNVGFWIMDTTGKKVEQSNESIMIKIKQAKEWWERNSEEEV